MKQVSEKSIVSAIEKVDGMTDDALDALIETFTLKQQNLVNYILQAGIEFENEELNIYSIYYYAIIMEAFQQEGLSIPEITEDDIDEFQEPFLLALDAIHKEEDYEPMHELLYQHHLINFLMSELSAPDDEGKELDEEMQTQLFLVVAGVIGLLNKSAQG